MMQVAFIILILHSHLLSRESDATKKNEPVIDWLDANVGRVSCSMFIEPY